MAKTQIPAVHERVSFRHVPQPMTGGSPIGQNARMGQFVIMTPSVSVARELWSCGGPGLAAPVAEVSWS